MYDTHVARPRLHLGGPPGATRAQQAGDDGLSPRVVADRLGHADVAETLRTYAYLWPSDQARAVAAADAVLRGLSHDRHLTVA